MRCNCAKLSIQSPSDLTASSHQRRNKQCPDANQAKSRPRKALKARGTKIYRTCVCTPTHIGRPSLGSSQFNPQHASCMDRKGAPFPLDRDSGPFTQVDKAPLFSPRIKFHTEGGSALCLAPHGRTQRALSCAPLAYLGEKLSCAAWVSQGNRTLLLPISTCLAAFL